MLKTYSLTKNTLLVSSESNIKNFLSNNGFNEIYNSSLVSEDLLKRANLSPDSHLKLKNALSEDYQYLRISLAPSILQNLKNNQIKSEEPYFLYELSTIYLKTNAKLPDEHASLVFATTIDYRHAKGLVESLLRYLNVPNVHFQNSTNQPAYFHDSQTANILTGSQSLGYLGFVKPSVLHNFGITTDPIIVEIDLPKLTAKISSHYTYQPISEFPEVSESLTITSDLPIGDIVKKISEVDTLIHKVTYTDSFKNKHTFKISFVSPKQNLTQTEVNTVKEKINQLFN